LIDSHNNIVSDLISSRSIFSFRHYCYQTNICHVSLSFYKNYSQEAYFLILLTVSRDHWM